MDYATKKCGWCLFALVSLLTGCASQPSTADLVKKLLVQTSYDSSINFKAYTTYSFVLDTVAYVSYDCYCWSLVADGRRGTYVRDITNNVKSGLDKSGFKQVDSLGAPDLAVHATIVDGFQVSHGHNYFFGQYSYGYQSYSFPFLEPSRLSQATLVIEVTDVTHMKNSGYPSVWVAYLSDIGTTNDISTNPTLIAGIQQAFSQSPYLTTGN